MTLESIIVNALSFIPPWLSVILIAAMPVFELRGSIPIAMYKYGYDPVTAFLLSIIGNMLPVIPLLLYLEPVSNYLRRWKILDNFFTWLFNRTYHKHNAEFEKYGSLGLAVFVGVPLPATGAWSGVLISWLLDLDRKKSILAIALGVVIAGILMLFGTLGFLSIFS